MLIGKMAALKLIVIYLIGLFWSFFVTLNVIRLIIVKRKKFFYKKNRTTPPAILQNKIYGQHHFIEVEEGIKLHYVESGSAEKPLMVMLHGLPEFWYSWRHQIREFQTDYRVVAVDLRGYGDSSKPSQVAAYTVKTLVGDIEHLIEAIAPNQKCVLLAHDWGGGLAWILAAQSPRLVDKVIIMNCPHPGGMMHFVNSSWKQLVMSWYMFFINLPYYPEWLFSSGDLKMLENAFQGKLSGAKKGSFTEEDMEAFKYTFNTKQTFTGPMNYIRASLRGLNRGSVMRQKVSSATPLLLIWGTKDAFLSKGLAEMSRDYAQDFTVRYVEGASHWVQQDEPELVNKYIREFIL